MLGIKQITKMVISMYNNDTVSVVLYKISDHILEYKNMIAEKSDMGLFSGKSGIALFLFHIYDFSKDAKYLDCAHFFLEKAFEDINSGKSLPTFCSGIAGVSWVINYLAGKSYIGDENLEVLIDLDDYLHKSMIKYAGNDDFDFLHGATGLALYFISRIKSGDKRSEYLADYVSMLKDHSVYNEYNKTYKRLSPVLKGESEYTSVYNLSMAHGSSSIISVLSKYYALGKNDTEVRDLISGYCRYLLNAENKEKYENGSMFPSYVNTDGSVLSGGRLGWCYGDLSNGLALLHAYNALENKDYCDKSLEIFLNSTERKDLKTQLIRDACMCHGAAGLAEIFQAAGEHFDRKELIDSATYWRDTTLDFYFNDNNIKGFSQFTLEGMKFEYGLLEGIAGIGMTLLSYLKPGNNKWRELFLIS